jgi:hypothetical protein
LNVPVSFFILACPFRFLQSAPDLSLASLLMFWTPMWWLDGLHAEKLDKTEKPEFGYLL